MTKPQVVVTIWATSSMDRLSLLPSEDGRYLVVTVMGDLGRARALEICIAAAQFADRLGIVRFLFDLREAKCRETTLNQYEFANRDVQESPELKPECRTALLIAPDDSSYQTAETFFWTSIPAARFFRDRCLADAYLTST